MNCSTCNSTNTSIVFERWEAGQFVTKRKKLICSDCNHIEILKETSEHNDKIVWFDNEKIV
jgi:transcriptional regulator NrdR family protein